MDIPLFKERIISTIVSRSKTIFSILIIILLLISIELIYYATTKSNDGFSLLSILGVRHTFKNRFSTKNQIAMKCIIAIVLLFYLAWSVVPAYRDIQNRQYIQIPAKYTHIDNSKTKNIFSNGYVWIESEEGGFYLELPTNWYASEFPIGTYYGVVSYSEESKILLSFDYQPLVE